MIYISLPYFYQNNDFASKLKLFCMKRNEKLLNFDCQIEYTTGSFPWCYWNGGINSNIPDQPREKLLLYKELAFFSTTPTPPLILDCSNLFISDTDLFDIHQNTILRLFQFPGYIVEVSDAKVYQYIKTNYPEYRFAVSANNNTEIQTADFFNENILDKDDFAYLILPSIYQNHPDVLKALHHKDKIIIVIGDKCNGCENWGQCKFNEQHNQYMFSNKCEYASCDSIINFTAASLKQEIDFYNSLGFEHFKLDEPLLKEVERMNKVLMKLIIKPEYIEQFLGEEL